jgi:hypothetical protein
VWGVFDGAVSSVMPHRRAYAPCSVKVCYCLLLIAILRRGLGWVLEINAFKKSGNHFESDLMPWKLDHFLANCAKKGGL